MGGGASADGIAAMGGPRRTPREMIAFTEEALGVMRRALRGGGVEFRSEQHAIEGYDAGPVPAAPVPLWLGANGKRMLEVTGRSSDGWVSPLSVYVSPADVPARHITIDEAARAAGRDPADVRRIYNVVGMIGPRAGGSGLIGDVGVVGRHPHRLGGGPGLRHVHLLAERRAATRSSRRSPARSFQPFESA